MALGATLGQVVEAVRHESGQSANAAFGANTADPLRHQIRRMYNWLHDDFDWPHLHIWRDEVLQPGERYYSYPADITFGRWESVQTLPPDMSRWEPVCYGITYGNLNAVNSDKDIRQDPVRRWQPFEGDQYEVWPIPAGSGGKLRIHGYAAPKALVKDADTLDIDDTLISLYVAAEILAKHDAADAKMKLSLATQRYQTLKAQASKIDRFRMVQSRREQMGGHEPIEVRAPGTY